MPVALQPRIASGEPWLGLSGESASGTHTLVSVTLPPAGPGLCNGIGGVLCSYSALPAGGLLQVADGAATVVSVDVPAAGPTPVAFPGPLLGSPNTAMTVALLDGGAAVVGRVQPLGVAVMPLPPATLLRPDFGGSWGPYF